jgi:hypothetical protein
MIKMMNLQEKNKEKATKIVAGAINTFTKAIAEVEKANELLVVAVKSDEQELVSISKKVEDLYKKLDGVQAEKLNKKATIIQNKELIAKLEQFTK